MSWDGEAPYPGPHLEIEIPVRTWEGLGFSPVADPGCLCCPKHRDCRARRLAMPVRRDRPAPLHEMCRPLMGLMKEVLLQSHVIEADETTVRQQAEGKGPTRECYFYSYVGDEAHPLVIYDDRPARTRAGPDDWFTEAQGDPLYHGYLQCDGHSTYDHLFDSGKPWGMTRVGCWAHARRKFHDARVEAAGPCHHALGQIRRLYEVEKRARSLDPDQRPDLREEFSRPARPRPAGVPDRCLPPAADDAGKPGRSVPAPCLAAPGGRVTEGSRAGRPPQPLLNGTCRTSDGSRATDARIGRGGDRGADVARPAARGPATRPRSATSQRPGGS